MSERESYPVGVPCWVEALQADVPAALRYYEEVFGWEFVGPPGARPEDPGAYWVARLRGRDMAGVAPLPPAHPDVRPAWMTHIRVDGVAAAAEAARAAGGSVLAEPFDALPAGRMAVLADPAGAGFCVWEPGTRQGAQLVNEPSAWAMSALRTSRPQAAAAFYAAVFGWTTEAFGPPEAGVAMFRLPGYVGGEPQQPVPRDVVATLVPAAPGEPASWALDFWTDDADRVAERTTRLGGRVLVAPHEPPGLPFRTAVVADPQGATFSVSQLVAAPVAAGP
jgi:hypothetical protein